MRRSAIALATCSLALLPLIVLVWMGTAEGGLVTASRLAQLLMPGLHLEAPSGRLLGDFHFDRIEYRTLQRRIDIEDVEVLWQPGALRNHAFVIDSLSIGRLQIHSRPGPTGKPPADLVLPLRLRVASFAIGRAAFGSLADGEAKTQIELSGLAGSLDSDNREHRIEHLRFDTGQLSFAADARIGTQAPFPVTGAVDIKGNAQGQAFRVALQAEGSMRALRLSARTVQAPFPLRANAELDTFAAQPLKTADLSARDIDPAAWFADAPHAGLDIEAHLAPKGLLLVGSISATNRQPGRLDMQRLPLRKLDAGLRQERGNWLVPHFVAELTAGRVAGSGSWSNDGGSIAAELTQVDAASWHKLLRTTRLSGPLEVRLSGQRMAVRSELAEPRFRLSLAATREGRSVRVERARLAAGAASFEVAGHLDADQRFTFDGTLNNFDPAAYAAVPSAKLNARLEAAGRIGGEAKLSFVLRDSRIREQPATGQGELMLRGDRIERASIELQAGDNRLIANGALGKPQDQLKLTLEAPHPAVFGIDGALRGSATLSGALRTPDIAWRLDIARLALPNGRLVRELTSTGELREQQWRVALDAAALVPGGAAPALADLHLKLDGRRDVHRIQLKSRVGDAHELVLAAEGGLDEHLTWSGHVTALEWRGPNAMRVTAPLVLEADAQHLALQGAEIAGIDWQAHVDRLRLAPNRLQTSGRLIHLPLALIPGAPNASLRLGGEWDIDFGDLLAGRMRLFRESGDLEISTAERTVALGIDRLQASAEFKGRAADLALALHGDRIGTLDGRLYAGLRPQFGSWALAGDEPWDGEAHIDMASLAWFGALAGKGTAFAGQLRGSVRLSGTPDAPDSAGQIVGNALRVDLPDYGTSLSDGTLRLTLASDMVRLEQLSFRSLVARGPLEQRIDWKKLSATPGQLSGEGQFSLGQRTGSLHISAQRLAVAQRPERWVMLSGDAQGELSPGAMKVDANLHIDAAYVELPPPEMPQLSQDVVVLGRQRQEQPLPGFVKLAANIDLGNDCYFQGAGIKSRLAGRISLAATEPEHLRAAGSIRTVGGTFSAYNRELAIERGILNFQGLIENPGLNVRALRKNQAVEAGVEVTGTVKDPNVRLVSVPDVPDPEKLSWLVLGRPPGGALSAQDADMLLAVATDLQGKGTGKGPLQSLTQGLGLEEISLSEGRLGQANVEPASHVAGSLDAGSGAEERIATVGKRLSSSVLLSYERSLTTAESVLKLTVDLSRRLSVVGRVGADNAVDLLYRFSFGGGQGGEAPSKP